MNFNTIYDDSNNNVLWEVVRILWIKTLECISFHEKNWKVNTISVKVVFSGDLLDHLNLISTLLSINWERVTVLPFGFEFVRNRAQWGRIVPFHTSFVVQQISNSVRWPSQHNLFVLMRFGSGVQKEWDVFCCKWIGYGAPSYLQSNSLLFTQLRLYPKQIMW